MWEMCRNLSRLAERLKYCQFEEAGYRLFWKLETISIIEVIRWLNCRVEDDCKYR